MRKYLMEKFGLNDNAYSHLMEVYNNDIIEVEEVVREWGVENCNKGYAIFDYDGTGMLQIEAIADCGYYDDDAATMKALEDGIHIIPVEELPENFDRKYYGWIDTEENRKRIHEYCRRCV